MSHWVFHNGHNHKSVLTMMLLRLYPCHINHLDQWVLDQLLTTTTMAKLDEAIVSTANWNDETHPAQADLVGHKECQFLHHPPSLNHRSPLTEIPVLILNLLHTTSLDLVIFSPLLLSSLVVRVTWFLQCFKLIELKESILIHTIIPN